MLAVVLATWVGARALTWENPFPNGLSNLPGAELILADNTGSHSRSAGETSWTMEVDPFAVEAGEKVAGRVATPSPNSGRRLDLATAGSGKSAATLLGHQLLWLQALGAKLPPGSDGEGSFNAIEEPGQRSGGNPAAPPMAENAMPGRWPLDLWGFWREGSDSAPISQGRVPIYGASQLGARLEWRAAPSSRRDPRLFARGYRALVSRGESELAVGVSVRPAGSVPVRIATEARLTDTRFGTQIRPAVIANSEIPAQQLPAGFRLEAYGGAGYVGGKGATAFADGQASVTRELAALDGPSGGAARFSIGAGAWAGAQKDASRIDVGPTIRLDLSIGEVPARLSIDWRERVGGDASPGSGVAATLSTRF